LEVAALGYKVRIKSGNLKSIDPPTIERKAKEQTRVFEIEEDARRYFKEQIELLKQVGFHPPSPINRKTAD